jgi:hypothetical protein
MTEKGKLTDDPAWKNLQDYFASMGSQLNMRNLFEQDKERFKKYR